MIPSNSNILLLKIVQIAANSSACSIAPTQMNGVGFSFTSGTHEIGVAKSANQRKTKPHTEQNLCFAPKQPSG